MTTPSDQLFGTDESVLLPGPAALLEADLSVLRSAVSVVQVEVLGHTDSRHPPGDPGYNDRLSQARADSVAVLVRDRFGIASGTVVARGLGYTDPVVEDGGPDLRTYREADGQRNRRVVVIIRTSDC